MEWKIVIISNVREYIQDLYVNYEIFEPDNRHEVSKWISYYCCNLEHIVISGNLALDSIEIPI